MRTRGMRRALWTSAGLLGLLGVALYLRPPAPAPAPKLRGLLVAHRAGLAHAPENSLQAVRYAADAGAGAVELDVRWGPAGELVCAHDAWQAASAPTLSDALTLALSRGLLVELDLKTPVLGDRALVREVSRQIHERQAHERVWVSAFQPMTAWQLRRTAPEIALGWPMTSTGRPWIDALLAWNGPARWMGASVLEPHEGLVTERRLARWTARWPVEVWVVHDPERARALQAQGHAVVVDRVP